ncbi:MAG: sodium-dependent transporter [bacterium]|nr:sodium-dependent transporter [bacterium]
MNEKRETLASSLGFLLVSAGCAVGLGNVWRFPYIVGQYGGALFVLLYIFFLVILGLPMLTAEFALGRASKTSIVRSYNVLSSNAGPFKAISKFQIAGNWVLMMFYTTVAGWMIAYPIAILNGWFNMKEITTNADYAENFFKTFTASPSAQIFWVSVVCLIGFGVCALGLKRGVENVTKKMMAFLFVILIGLAIYVFTLDGAGKGLHFYLVPNFDVLKEKNIFDIITAALGQSFFTLSLGIGSMSIFGSYTSRSHSLYGESAKIIAIDTFIALLSGLIIFPACFAYGSQPDEGPGLIFFILPKVFAQMPGGIWVGAIFFIFLALAALTTIITVFENIIAMTMDNRQCSRKTAIKRTAPLLFLLSLPCALSFGLLANIKLGKLGILDMEDFFVSNVALPLGSLAILVFCVCRKYWGWEKFRQEANEGQGLKLPNFLRHYMAWGIPVIILFVFVVSLITAIKNAIPA